MRITAEHVGKYVRAESWHENQAVKVLSITSSHSFRGRRGDGFINGLDRDDGLNPWVLVNKKGGSMAKFETFWILWQPASHLPPTRRFSSKKEAQEVAEAMTKKHNREFYVMKADGLCELAAPPVKWSDARAN